MYEKRSELKFTVKGAKCEKYELSVSSGENIEENLVNEKGFFFRYLYSLSCPLLICMFNACIV